jgi:SHS2 domain-containing protein
MPQMPTVRSKRPRYRIASHTADVAIEARGETPAALYANAAAGMFSLIAGCGALRPEESVAVAAEGIDPEHLLVRWLSELLALHRDGWALCRFDVETLSETGITATAWGRRAGPGRAVKAEIKTVTHHGVRIERDGEGFRVTVIFDV